MNFLDRPGVLQDYSLQLLRIGRRICPFRYSKTKLLNTPKLVSLMLFAKV